MLLFFYGQDTYRLHQGLKALVTYYQRAHPNGLFFRYVDCEKIAESTLLDEIWQESLLQERKLFIFANFTESQKIKDYILKNYSAMKESRHIFVFWTKEADPKDESVRLLKQHAEYKEYPLLEGMSLRHWIQKEVQNFGLEIEPKAVSILAATFGSNLWQIENEIKRLVAFKKKGLILATDVGIFLKPSTETTIFQMMDAIAAKNKRRVLDLLKERLNQGDNLAYLLAMVIFQFRNMILLKELLDKGTKIKSISKITGLHPYIIQKTIVQLHRFSFSDLKKIYHKLFKVDYEIKTGRLDGETGLELFLADMM